MQKCYIAYFSYQDDSEIFGVYYNRADAEERCLIEYEERKGVGYFVEEYTIE